MASCTCTNGSVVRSVMDAAVSHSLPSTSYRPVSTPSGAALRQFEGLRAQPGRVACRRQSSGVVMEAMKLRRRSAWDEDKQQMLPVTPEDNFDQASQALGRKLKPLRYTEEEQRLYSSPVFDLELQDNASFEAMLDLDRAPAKWPHPSFQRKTKIVCTIGPTCNSREMIFKLAKAGMNVARLNMSHGEHSWHREVVEKVREYNASVGANVLALMLDTKGPEVRSGDLPAPINLEKGDDYCFTIERGVGDEKRVSVNYDGFIGDVEIGDMVLVDGGMMTLLVKEKTDTDVQCEVVDGGELKSRRHLNVRGKSATLPSITEKDWEDIKFGVEHGVDYYALSFVKDANVVHELKEFLAEQRSDIKVLVKIESADSVNHLHSILEASDGAMVARGDLGAELPVEEVPLLQSKIIRMCRSMGKPVIVATNMLESMIVHPAPTRAEVSDIAIAVREGTDAIMLSGETAHGKYPLKAVKVMHTVALRTEATMPDQAHPPNLGRAFKNHMSEMFAFHATVMANTMGASIVVFTRSGFMAMLLSHYRPLGTTFAFTNDKRVQQRLALYHGVRALYQEFTADAEETFTTSLQMLLKQGLVSVGEEVALVQSGRQPIWRSESTHHIQVRTIRPLEESEKPERVR